MRSKLLSILGALTMFATPALAQNCSTQYPPDPQANMSPAGPCNGLPPGAATAQFPTFGGVVATTQVGPGGSRQPQRARGAVTPPVTPQQRPVLLGAE